MQAPEHRVSLTFKTFCGGHAPTLLVKENDVQRDTDIVRYGYVYKVTFPNGKIYVGRDTAETAEFDYYKYMGSPILKTKQSMHADMSSLLNAQRTLTLTKELLYEARECTVAHIKQKERDFIALLRSTDRAIGYNM
jgi:hypothetical protein